MIFSDLKYKNKFTLEVEMYNKKKILAFIPARFGSKRIPHKNFLDIGGKKLFMYSVEHAKESRYIDDILVSSDNQNILDLAHKHSCLNNSIRPSNLATDTSRIIDAILYELSQLEKHYDILILLQPTYPLRPKGIIDDAIKKYFTKETSLISVVKCTDQPEFIRYVKNDVLHKILPYSSDIRSQDFTQYFKIVGSIYINNIPMLNENTVLNENEIPYILDDYYALDIDTYKDLNEFNNRIKK